MGDVNWSPEDFARILSLPPAHPDRLAAESDLAFEAWVRMHEAFESRTGGPLNEAQMAGPRAELTARLQGTLGLPPSKSRSQAREAAAPATPARSGGVLDGLLGWLGAPAGRAALAFGVLVIVAASGWWITSRPPETPAIRGGDTTGVPVLAEPASANGRLDLSWSTVPGADGYRVVFYDAELAQVAQIDSLRQARCELRAGVLPSGLASRARVEVEVVALSHGDPLSRSRLRSITLP